MCWKYEKKSSFQLNFRVYCYCSCLFNKRCYLIIWTWILWVWFRIWNKTLRHAQIQFPKMHRYPENRFYKMCQNFTFLSGSFWLFSVVTCAYLLRRWSTFTLDFGCWLLDHVIYLKLSKVTKWRFFSLKRQPRTIFSENSCHFVNLLSLTNNYFFLSLR